MLALVIVLVRVVVAYALLLHDGHELRPAGAGKAARALLGRAALLLRRVGVLIAGRKGPRAVALAVGAVSAALAVGALLPVALAIGALLPVALAVGTALPLGCLLYTSSYSEVAWFPHTVHPGLTPLANISKYGPTLQASIIS